jgi:hypothetical protein
VPSLRDRGVKAKLRMLVWAGDRWDDFVFKLAKYQKVLVFPRVLKAKNEDYGKSSDSSLSRGETILPFSELPPCKSKFLSEIRRGASLKL